MSGRRQDMAGKRPITSSVLSELWNSVSVRASTLALR